MTCATTRFTTTSPRSPKSVSRRGIPRDHVYTHTVAMASVDPARANTGTPPIWAAVNAYSIPGFTMDNDGAAVYDLAQVKRQIVVADPAQTHFAVAESYLFHYGDELAMRANLSEAFDNGATIKGFWRAAVFENTGWAAHSRRGQCGRFAPGWVRERYPPSNDEGQKGQSTNKNSLVISRAWAYRSALGQAAFLDHDRASEFQLAVPDGGMVAALAPDLADGGRPVEAVEAIIGQAVNGEVDRVAFADGERGNVLSPF